MELSTSFVSDTFGNGSPLYQILNAQQLVPGEEPSYQICKLLYLYHPLGKKIVDAPISKAMGKRRDIIITEDISERLVKRYNEVWDLMSIDDYIANTYRLSRIYGAGSVAVIPDNGKSESPLTPEELRKKGTNLKFSVFDPLNTAGSMVGVLDPNDPQFLKYATIAVAGKPYAKSRAHIQLYEQPIYLSYTNSAFGYVGRSVFNRALYPLQSFLSSMITDNMVVLKSGVLVAKVRQPGSISDRIMHAANQFRLNILKSAKTGNTIAVQPDEDIQSLDLHNLDYAVPRNNILENIALSLDMPSSFLTNESLAQGFGEGSEDAKLIAGYIDDVRLEMQPLYDFFDNIVQHVAWSPDYFETLQAQDKDYKGMSFEEFFSRARRSFRAKWPAALEPTKKELVLMQKEQYTSVLEVYNTLAPTLSGENLARLIDWTTANLNEAQNLFPNRLELDAEEVAKESEQLAKQNMKMTGVATAGGGLMTGNRPAGLGMSRMRGKPQSQGPSAGKPDKPWKRGTDVSGDGITSVTNRL